MFISKMNKRKRKCNEAKSCMKWPYWNFILASLLLLLALGCSNPSNPFINNLSSTEQLARFNGEVKSPEFLTARLSSTFLTENAVTYDSYHIRRSAFFYDSPLPFNAPVHFFRYKYTFTIKDRETNTLHIGSVHPWNWTTDGDIAELIKNMESPLCMGYNATTDHELYRAPNMSVYVRLKSYGDLEDDHNISDSYNNGWGRTIWSHLPWWSVYDQRVYKRQRFSVLFAETEEDLYSEEVLNRELESDLYKNVEWETTKSLSPRILYCFIREDQNQFTWNHLKEALGGTLTDFQLKEIDYMK